jgi:hypothetical protein
MRDGLFSEKMREAMFPYQDTQPIEQHEFIDTTAKWGRDFVEVLNPLKENEILRVYYEPSQQPEMTQFNFQEYGPDNWGDSQVTKPEFVAEQKAKNEALRSMVQPKPVAYINVEERKLEWARPIKWETPTVVKMDKVPLYAKREWVGLTSEEIMEITGVTSADSDWNVTIIHKWIRDIEAKLKEKNV